MQLPHVLVVAASTVVSGSRCLGAGILYSLFRLGAAAGTFADKYCLRGVVGWATHAELSVLVASGKD